MRFLFALLVLIYPADSVLTSDQLKKDFSVFRTSLEEAHGGLYRYRSKAEMDAMFDRAASAIQKPMSTLEFYKQLTPIISALGCGHTSMKMPERWYEEHGTAKTRFPFDVVLTKDKVIISKNYSADSDLAPGTEITAIDGQSMTEVINTIQGRVSGDGFIATGRRKAIQRNFARVIKVYVNDASQYSLKVKSANGVKAKPVSLVDASSIKAEPNRPGLEFEVKDNSTAVLTVRSFVGFVSAADGTKFRPFLEKAFSTLKERKITNLIIDVRGNGGGNDDYGALLFAYLTDQPFRYYAYLEVNKPPYSFLKYSDKSEAFNEEMAAKLVRDEKGRYVFKENEHPCLPLQQPQKNHFDGKVIVLIDGGSFSATSEFAAAVRQHKRGVFIGEETGGAFEGNTSGYGIGVTLPESKITYYIPLIKYVCAVDLDPKLKGRGIIPDIVVEPAIESTRDNAVERAMTEISKSR